MDNQVEHTFIRSLLQLELLLKPGKGISYRGGFQDVNNQNVSAQTAYMLQVIAIHCFET